MEKKNEVAQAFGVAAFVALLLAASLFAGCISTRPVAASTRIDGTRVGVSRQTVFLRAFDNHNAIAVAQDNAAIVTIDSVTTKRHPRAFGSAYVTTVTGR